MAGARARVPAGEVKEPLTRQRTAWRCQHIRTRTRRPQQQPLNSKRGVHAGSSSGSRAPIIRKEQLNKTPSGSTQSHKHAALSGSRAYTPAPRVSASSGSGSRTTANWRVRKRTGPSGSPMLSPLLLIAVWLLECWQLRRHSRMRRQYSRSLHRTISTPYMPMELTWY